MANAVFHLEFIGKRPVGLLHPLQKHHEVTETIQELLFETWSLRQTRAMLELRCK